MTLIRTAAIVAAALLLAACYMSRTPLFDPRDAEFPIADGVYTRINEFDGKREDITFRRRGAWYDVTVGTQGVRRLMFRSMGDVNGADAYAYMTGSGEEYFYGVMLLRRNSIEEIVPDCSEDSGPARRAGARETDDGECVFRETEQILQALEDVAYEGRPDYRIVRRQWGY